MNAPAMESIWARIKRHKVAEWTLAYVAFSYALLHGVEVVGEALEWPSAVPRFTLFALLLGTPIAATLAYYHGHRAQHRVSRIEISILAALLVVAGSVLWVLSRSTHERALATTTALVGPAKDARPDFSPPQHSVAVLPFTNLSGDPTQDYFSDGMSEELINALSHIDALEVTARTSSFAFKGQNIDIGTIARKLNVGAILVGSVRRSGNTLRITAQLVNAASGFDLWSDTYDRDSKDILRVQRDVATAVVQQLKVKLTGEVRSRIELGGTSNSEAYDAYLRGQQMRSKAASSLDEAGYRAALAQFDQAIALDPEYALAYIGKARTLGTIAVFFSHSVQQFEVGSEARAAAERAISLAPNLGEAHLELAEVLAYSFLDFTAALPEFDRALALAPGSSLVQGAYGAFSGQLGHVDAAIAASRTAVRLDPENLDALVDLGQTLALVRHYEEALAALQHARVLDPQSEFTKGNIAYVLLASDQPERARPLCESLSTPKGLETRHFCLAVAYHALGKQADAERELDECMALAKEDGSVEYADVYAQWGRKKETLRWLTIAVNQRASSLQRFRADWMLDPIREESDFKALERQLNFPP